MKKIVLASNNQGKLRELRSILEPNKFNLIPQAELGIAKVAETAITFVENALIKARHAAQVTGLPTLADDSGLAVDALNGQPGIYSARYAGESKDDQANIDKLLTEMSAVTAENRQAQFHCVIVYLRSADDPIPVICHGIWQGTILFKPQGKDGFGYDPIFYVPEFNCSAAELAPAEKNKISHRGQALQQLLTYFHAQ